MKEWFADGNFWASFSPIMFDSERWAEVPAVVDSIEELVRPPPGCAVLDSCCGPGRHALELAARGYRVTGLDITESFLEAGTASARDFGLDIEFVHADARRFCRPDTFGLALNLFTSFGYFDSPDDDVTMLSSLKKSLKPGGALVMETLGREIARRDYLHAERFKRGPWDIESSYSPVGDWEGLRTRWRARDGSKTLDHEFTQRLYSRESLEQACLSAGFSAVSAFGSWSGDDYDEKAIHLIVIARTKAYSL